MYLTRTNNSSAVIMTNTIVVNATTGVYIGSGIGGFEVIERESRRVLYSRGFASIYGEWETTVEAKTLPQNTVPAGSLAIRCGADPPASAPHTAPPRDEEPLAVPFVE